MLFNYSRCAALKPDYVNSASGLQLHRFEWLGDENLISPLPPGRWNHLIDVRPADPRPTEQGGPGVH